MVCKYGAEYVEDDSNSPIIMWDPASYHPTVVHTPTEVSDVHPILFDFHQVHRFNRGYRYLLVVVNARTYALNAVPLKSMRLVGLMDGFRQLLNQPPIAPLPFPPEHVQNGNNPSAAIEAVQQLMGNYFKEYDTLKWIDRYELVLARCRPTATTTSKDGGKGGGGVQLRCGGERYRRAAAKGGRGGKKRESVANEETTLMQTDNESDNTEGVVRKAEEKEEG